MAIALKQISNSEMAIAAIAWIIYELFCQTDDEYSHIQVFGIKRWMATRPKVGT